MSKVICIYPLDMDTAFLKPLCDYICSIFGAYMVGFDTSSDDDPHEFIYNEIENAQSIFFLGHGKSDCLYASIRDNDKLIDETNIYLLERKQVFILACNSNQFITHFKLTNAVGFGFLPTSMDDVWRVRNYHSLDISTTTSLDVDSFKKAMVNCIINSLSIDTLRDYSLFAERMRFNASKEIVDCLVNAKAPNYRIVADELYFLYKDLLINK